METGTQATKITERHACTARVYHNQSFRSYPCLIPATVQRERVDVEHVKVAEPREAEGWEGLPAEERTERKSVIKLVWYCKTHDPERIAEREQKKRDEWNAECERKNKAYREAEARKAAGKASAEALVARLGFGYAREDGGVYLPPEVALTLVTELERLRGITNEFGQVVR